MGKRTRSSIPLALVLIRVVTGAILLRHGWEWVTAGGFDGQVVRRSIELSLPQVSGFASWWADTVLSSNPDAFAFFWRWAALLLGGALVLGAFTRPAGSIAVVFLAHAYAYGSASDELAVVLLALCCFACAVTGVGRRLGLDAMFDETFPSWVTWTRREESSFLTK